MALFPASRNTKKFFIAQACVALIACVILIKAIIGGAIVEYNMPFSTWPASLYISEFFMILVYTLVFTILFSIPLWYFFIGEQGSSEQK